MAQGIEKGVGRILTSTERTEGGTCSIYKYIEIVNILEKIHAAFRIQNFNS